jgi:hypothetical protein
MKDQQWFPRVSAIVLTAVVLMVSSETVFAAKDVAFPPMKETKAYQQFRLRPVTDFSKLVYLIDRFSSLDLQIVYDGHYYEAAFAGRIAKWFLGRNYKKETPKDWIMRWCNTSVPAGNIIYVKMPNGKFKLSREVLTQELADLDQAIEDNKNLPMEISTEKKVSSLNLNGVGDAMAQTVPSPVLDSEPNKSKAKPQAIQA